tara:strand:+ start:717 stop:944 length:228 start_codon:yes stop_codon:yes gene_type:complete
MDRENIKLQAKKIIDSFARELEKVKVEESRVERDEDRREEREGDGKENSDFRKIMFKNAPKTRDDCIEAEKGGWV